MTKTFDQDTIKEGDLVTFEFEAVMPAPICWKNVVLFVNGQRSPLVFRLARISRKHKRALWPVGSKGMTFHELLLKEAWVDGFDTGLDGQMGLPGGANPYRPKTATHEAWSKGFDDGSTCG